MKHSFYQLWIIILALTACTGPTPQGPDAVSPTPIPTSVSTLQPTQTEPPTPAVIPGFEGGSILNRNAVEIEVQDGNILMTLKHRALWFMNQRGVLLYKPVTGNFKISAQVYTSKSSDPTQEPGGDATVQLGGLMARNGSGGRENYVFIVAGDDGNGLSIETKNTIDNSSEYDGPAWDAPEAELRLCRFGTTFQLYKRHIDSAEPWLLAAAYDRPDLPETLQVGLNIYSDSTPDLQVRYEDVSIQPIASQDECQTD